MSFSGIFSLPLLASGLFFSVLAGSTQGQAGEFTIEVEAGSDVAPEKVLRLKEALFSATTFFRANISDFSGPLLVRVGKASDALRTGYSYKEGILHFPTLKQVRDQGLASVDVIRHEAFHLLVCKAFQNACPENLASQPEWLSLHEALADYFAYGFEPDGTFGEDYFHDRAFMRTYRTDLRLSLIEGAHAQGNVIAGVLIQDQVPWARIREFLLQGEWSRVRLAERSVGLQEALAQEASFELSEEIQGDAYPPSRLRRYRLKAGVPLALRFRPNSALLNVYPDLRIRWSNEAGEALAHFEVLEKENLHFEVREKKGAKSEKAIASILHGDRVLGARAFYFGVIQHHSSFGPGHF